MKLTYQTGIATLIQFIVLSLFTLGSQVVSIVSTCRQSSSDCVSNLLTSVIFYILVAIFFGGIWVLGYAAQNSRNRRLAQLLICIEAVIALGALFSIKVGLHQTKNAVPQFAALGILIMAVWIITLAFRLMRAGGRRVVSRQRRHSD